MAIDLDRETVTTLARAGQDLLPHFNGKPVAASTMYRWIHQGVRAGDGSRIRLEAVRIGRSLVTTKEAVRRFTSELTRRSGIRAPTKVSSDVTPNLKAQGLL